MNNALVVGGLGVVGTATRKLFDIKDYYDLKGKTVSIKETGRFKYVFICLPTKPDSNGYNINPIIDVIKKIDAVPHEERIYILRSTVIPGSTESISLKLNLDNIIHNPEFLTMRTIDEDTFNPDIVVLGGKAGLCMEVAQLYLEHVKNSPMFYMTGSKESEMIKLATNVFYAMKVVYGNQIYDICQKEGIKYEVVKEALYHRKWIGNNHLDAIHDGKRGAGGMCLKKDLEAFNRRFKLPLFEIVERINNFLLKMKL